MFGRRPKKSYVVECIKFKKSHFEIVCNDQREGGGGGGEEKVQCQISKCRATKIIDTIDTRWGTWKTKRDAATKRNIYVFTPRRSSVLSSDTYTCFS